jgi:hypothetical protein
VSANEFMRPFEATNEVPHGSGEHCATLVLDSGWRLTLWLGEQDGRKVVTELRLHPDEGLMPPGSGERLPPTWSHSADARAAMPTGGITARTLKGLALGHYTAELQRAVSEKLELDHLLRHDLLDLVEVTPAAGPHGRPDTFYAHLAQEYVRTVASGSRAPLAELGRRLHSTPNTTAARIKEARRRGLLTRTERGRLGGELTEKARTLLSAEQGGTDGAR